MRAAMKFTEAGYGKFSAAPIIISVLKSMKTAFSRDTTTLARYIY